MTFLTILFILVCILMIFLVILSPSQEGGMAATFGGLGSESFFGTKAHQQLSKVTVFLAVSFLVLAVAINRMSAGTTAPGGGIKDKVEEHGVEPSPGEQPPPSTPAPEK